MSLRPTARQVYGLLGLLTGLAVWQLYSMTQENELFLPSVTSMIAGFGRLLMEPDFYRAYLTTLQPFLYGWLLAVVVGVLAGLMIGRLDVVDRLTKPYVAFLNALPVSTLIPLVVITFGIGMVARTSVVFLFAVVEVTLSTAAGAREVRGELLTMSHSFQANRLLRFRRVVLPGALPGILAGVRVGSARAVVGMVVMELLLVSVGVGLLLLRYSDTFRSAELYALVVSLAMFGMALQAGLRWIERRVLRWRPEAWGTE